MKHKGAEHHTKAAEHHALLAAPSAVAVHHVAQTLGREHLNRIPQRLPAHFEATAISGYLSFDLCNDPCVTGQRPTGQSAANVPSTYGLP